MRRNVFMHGISTNNFIETLFEMQKATSTDLIRYFITGVCLDLKDGKLRMRSTDGHAMAERLMPIPEGLETLDKPFIVDPDSLKILKAFYKGNKRIGHMLKVTNEGNVPRIVVTCMGNSVTINRIDGEYPNTEHVKQPDSYFNFKVGLNPELLETLAASLRAESRDMMAILEFSTENPGGVIRVTVSENQGLLMPMRINK